MRSCRAGVLSGATAGQPTFIGQSRYRVGLSGQYYTGTTRLGGTPVTFAQLLYFPHRLQESQWLASGWVVETAGDVSHLDAPALDELQR